MVATTPQCTSVNEGPYDFYNIWCLGYLRGYWEVLVGTEDPSSSEIQLTWLPLFMKISSRVAQSHEQTLNFSGPREV